MTGNAVSTTASDVSQGNRDAADGHDAVPTDRWAKTPSTWRRDPSIEFRVRCEGQPTRRLRLSGARYTLGNGVGCSIRLEDDSLRSLHAVLIRDHERILVRAYSVPIQINGVRVTEGMITPGDRLRLGAYEFELLESEPRPVDAVSQAVAHGLVGFDGHVDSRGESAQDWSKSFHEEAKQWRALKQDVQRRDEWCKTREQELLEQQRKLELQMQSLQQREDELQTQESAAIEVHEEFQRRYEDLLKHRDELQMQQEELATGREHLRLQQERLDGRDRLHRQQIERLLEEQERYKRQESVHAQKIAESEERVRASRMQAEAATTAVEQMREKFASLNEQLVQLSSQQETLQQLELERNREHQQRIDDLQFDRDEAISQRNEIAEERDASREAQAKTEAERKELASRCVELESIEEQLRSEIQELQSEIARTRMDAESLDKDCELARRTITNLEDTIRENRERHEADRQSWTAEVETLRSSLEELSVDLAGAQAQLSKLREENDRLVEQLTGAHAERDEARAERETAVRECEIARGECDAAKIECEAARRDLEAARNEVVQARQERDDAAAERNALIAERDDLLSFKQRAGQDRESAERTREQWALQQEQAERRYQEAQTHLADARQKCEQAVRVRDEAESARQAAEAKLESAMEELKAMQAERDLAIREQDELRRQRDDALKDAKDSRELFDRSNRDHDDTLDRIEFLEQQTREIIGAPGAPEQPTTTPKLGLVGGGLDVAEDNITENDVEASSVKASNLEASNLDASSVANEEDAPQWSVEDSAETPEVAASTAFETEQPEAGQPETEQPETDAPVSAIDNIETEPETSSHFVADQPTAIETSFETVDDNGVSTPESMEDEDVWPTYSSIEPESDSDSVDEEAPSLSMLATTTESDDAPAAETDVEPSAIEAPGWNSVLIEDEDVVAGTGNVVEEENIAEPSASEEATNEAFAEDVPAPEMNAEPVWGGSEEPSVAAEMNSVADEEPAAEEVNAVADEPVAEDLPQWPDESQTYLLPQERGDQDCSDLNRSDEVEQYHEPTFDSPETDERVEESASEWATQAASFEPAQDSEAQGNRFEDSELQASAEAVQSEPVGEYETADDYQSTEGFAGASGFDQGESFAQFESQEEDEPAAGEGSLADQLMRDLGIEKNPALSIDDDEEESASIEDTSATAMWNSRNDWDQEEADSEPQSEGFSQTMAIDSDDADSSESPYADSIDQYRDEATASLAAPAEMPVAEEPVVEAPVAETPVADSAAATVVAGGADEGEPEDDSIEAYMNRLLQRVQGQPETGDAPAVAAKPVEPAPKADTHVTEEMPPVEVAEEPVTEPEVDPNAPLVPRSQAPERNSDLSAMRELANASARSAITRSNKTQSHTTRMQAMVKFGQAGIAMLCGIAAVALVNLPMLKMIAAVAALIIAAICVKEGYSLLTDLNTRSKDTPSEGHEESQEEAEAV
ncbi:myosin heavy chain [Rhodopirellula sallentina SM41]|uniref:Myosin heavy chain n=1 Tax=Rhodopirellula sallentina SM41 TaxID=1263870 RepID=M5U9H5_9BACT|nr:myosin heavy chain [Rhodopirellula sallentina SM41]